MCSMVNICSEVPEFITACSGSIQYSHSHSVMSPCISMVPIWQIFGDIYFGMSV